jgi:hypothetical protein
LLHLLASASCLIGAAAGPRSSDTLAVARLAAAPVVDGRVGQREYGTPTLDFATAAGDVRVWLGRQGDFIYLAAILPDSTFYWGDDFVISLDPDGSGGSSPGEGDRQWYVRRVLDSSVVAVANQGSWFPPSHQPAVLGSTHHYPDWDVAVTSSATEWTVELRVRAAVLRPGLAAPRIAFRTYNDQPAGWWSWPAPPPGVPAQRVEQSPDLWAPMRLP